MHAGFLLGVAAVVRYIVFALNYEVLCSGGQCPYLPNVSDVSNYEHGHLGLLRFAMAWISTVIQDVCSWHILTSAFHVLSPGKYVVDPIIFDGVLGTCLVLDALQVSAVTFKYHWVIIQLSGAFMYVAMAIMWVALVQSYPRKYDGYMTLVAAVLLMALGACCLALVCLFAAKKMEDLGEHDINQRFLEGRWTSSFQFGSEMWCLLEYLALFLSTCYQMALGSLIPPLRVAWCSFPQMLKVSADRSALPILHAIPEDAET